MSTQICTGFFTNVASTPFFLPLEQQINEFSLRNLTRSGVTAGGIAGALTSTRIVKAWFNPSVMSNGTALIEENGTVVGTLAPLNVGNLAQNGFTVFNAANQSVGAVVAIASFTPGTTTVWTTSTPHGFQIGDTVRVYGLTAAPQFSGLAMTVTAVGSTTTFTTLLDSTGATTSAGSVVRIGNFLIPTRTGVYPENRVIAKITNANPMVITLLVAQNYFPGNVVTFSMPSKFGMPQLTNSLSGLPFQATVISAVNTVGVQTVTVAVDSTNFGVFATNSVVGGSNPGHWPLAPAFPMSFPTLVPDGEGNTNNLSAFGVLPTPLPYGNQDVLSFAKQNNGYNGILIGAGDGTNASTTGGIIGSTIDVWEWRAITSLQQFP